MKIEEKIKQLKEKRGALKEKMDGVCSLALTEKRSLTTEESTEWDKNSTELDKFNKELSDLEEEEKRNLKSIIVKMQKEEVQQTEWRNVQTGAAINVLTKEQNFSDGQDLDTRSLSAGNAVRGIVTGNWKNAEAEQRAMSTTAGGTGYTIPEVLSSKLIDMARAKSVLVQAGARTVGMDSNNLTIARVTAEPTLEYKAENAAFSEKSMTFEPVTLSTYTVGSLVVMSKELVQDSPNAAQAIEQALSAAIALEYDRAGLIGSGTTQPTGILNQAGVQEVLAVGDLTNYAKFVNAWGKVLSANGTSNGWIISPREAETLELLLTTNGDYMQQPKAIAALRQHISNQLPINLGVGTDESLAFLGDFAQCFFGIRQGIEIRVSDEAGELFAKNQVGIRVVSRFDFALERPQHLVRLKGITA